MRWDSFGNRPRGTGEEWEFFKSAKGAAHTAKTIRNFFAPHSVLREFLRRRRPRALSCDSRHNGRP